MYIVLAVATIIVGVSSCLAAAAKKKTMQLQLFDGICKVYTLQLTRVQDAGVACLDIHLLPHFNSLDDAVRHEKYKETTRQR